MKEVTNTVTTDFGVEVYTNKILEYLDQFCAENNIDDLKEISQSRWNAALMYVNFNYIKPNKKLFMSKEYVNKVPSTPTMLTNNGAYDIEIINNICDLYMFLCYQYDKEISLVGFSKLTGINLDTFYQWSNQVNRSNTRANEIYKKLSINREETLSDKLFTGGVNPVGILGILNRHYGWNMGQPRGNTQQATQSIEDIRAKYKGLTDSEEQKALPPIDIE